MYIPSIVIAIIMAIVIIYVWLSNDRKEQAEFDAKQNAAQQRYDLLVKHANDKEIEKEKNTLSVIAILLDCSKDKAENILKLLKETSCYSSFQDAETRKEKMGILDEAKRIADERKTIKEFITRDLVPVIDENGYEIDVDKLYEFFIEWDNKNLIRFNALKDVSTEKKLYQFSTEYKGDRITSNERFLLNSISHIYDGIIEDFSTDTCRKLSDDEVLSIVDCICKKFNISIPERTRSVPMIKKYIYEDYFIPARSSTIQALFFYCMYFSTSIYNYITNRIKEEHILLGSRDEEAMWAFRYCFRNNFFCIFHYDITDFENIFFNEKDNYFDLLNEQYSEYQKIYDDFTDDELNEIYDELSKDQ